MSEIFKDKEKYSAFIFTSITVCDKDENGVWAVKQNVVQERKEPDREWEKKEAQVNVKNKDLQKAISEAYLSLAFYLESVKGDLFNKPEKEESELIQ